MPLTAQDAALTINRNFTRAEEGIIKKFKNIPTGNIGLPIAIGGGIVDAGDILVGDQDGVVVVSRNKAEAKVRKIAMPKHKVLYFSHAPENVYEIIRQEVPDDFELITLKNDSDEERKDKISECEVVIVAARPMTRTFVAAAPKLKLVHHQGVGYEDTVDLEALSEKKIALALTPEGTTVGVAEHTVLLTLAVCKRLPFADSELRQGRWHVNSLRPYSIELYERTIGYVGMGRIGREAATRFKAFGTRGIYYDLHVRLSPERESEFGLRWVEFETLLSEADIVSLHVPGGQATYHLIDEAALRQMKK